MKRKYPKDCKIATIFFTTRNFFGEMAFAGFKSRKNYTHSMTIAAGKDIIKSFADRMPESPGVYRMLNKKGEPLYIGKARALKRRVMSYTQVDRLPTRLRRMVAETHEMTFTLTETEVEALLLEANLVKSMRPKYNVMLLDDKSFPYVVLDTGHEFPSIGKHRGSRDKTKMYFGPFASADSVNKSLLDLQRGFLVRNCADSFFANRKRPCLQYHIKRCTAPCVGMVSKEDYARQVQEAKAFLDGDTTTIKARLQEQMMAASEAQDYETAARLRDRIQALAHVQSSNAVYNKAVKEADVFVMARRGASSAISVFFIRAGRNYGHTSFYPKHDDEESNEALMSEFIGQFYAKRPVPKCVLVSDVPDEHKILEEALAVQSGHKVEICKPQRGERAQLLEWTRKTAEANLAMHISRTKAADDILEKLQNLAEMKDKPQRIEIYDNSHIQGAYKVGAYVVYRPTGFDKKQYRQYNIQTTELGDDFAMMREVLMRRAKRAGEGGESPDLMLIDGGKGQLSQVMAMLGEFWPEEVPPPTVIAVAKGPDRNAGREALHFPDGREERLAPDDPLLHFIQRLRDEAHRFVIGRHRLKREKAIEISSLDDLPNIGPARKKALLHHFGSAKATRKAGVKELSQVPGISKQLAEQIYKYYNE